MADISDLVKKALKSAGAERVAVRNELGCSLIESDFGDEVIISAIYGTPKGSSYLVKLVPASKAYMALEGCEALKYIPYGLYALVEEDSDVYKISDKVKKVMRLRSIWK